MPPPDAVSVIGFALGVRRPPNYGNISAADKINIMPGQKFGERIRSVKRAAGRDGGDIHRSLVGSAAA
jgi:hypothetical protein